MRKLGLILLALLVTCSFAFAGGASETQAVAVTAAPVTTQTTATDTSASTTTDVPEESHIGIVTGTVSQSEDDPLMKAVTFTIANGAEPESLDPSQIQGVPEHRIFEALFEGLVAVDPQTADGVPGVAESWDVSDDGLTYTFHLREDAVWSDGVPITADDVVYSWLRELAPETASPYAWFPAMFIAGATEYNAGEAGADAVQIRAVDDHTFEMTLIGPLPYVIGALCHYSFGIVPQHAIEKYGQAWTQPENFVGNGPFVLTEHVPQDRIVCEKNPLYWDAENVALDEVVFLASDDTATNYNMYVSGEVDWNTSIDLNNFDQISMRTDYQVAPQLSTYYYTINVTEPPFDDPLVRKAISYAIDREELVYSVTRAGQIPCWGIVPEMAGYEPLEESDIGGALYDPDYARELLALAGYPNGIGFPTVSILYNTDDAHRQIAEFIQQQLKDNLNINVELENQEWATYLANRNAGNFQIARAGWVGDYQDPNTFLDMFITGAGMNGGKYSNPEYDALINQAARMPAGEERMATLKAAEDILINQDQAIIPLYFYVSQNMIDTNKWGGWYPNTMDYHPVKNIYLK